MGPKDCDWGRECLKQSGKRRQTTLCSFHVPHFGLLKLQKRLPWGCIGSSYASGLTYSLQNSPGATPKRNAGPFPERGRSPSGGKGRALRFPRPPTPLIPHGNGPVPSNRSVAPSARRRKACRQVRRDGPRRVGDDPAGRGFPQGGRARRNASAGVRQARTLRGRASVRSWTALTSASVTFRKSVPLGRYPRTRPLVCPVGPRSQEW